MPLPQQPALPAVLIPNFTGDACKSLAAELVSRGFPVIAACATGGEAEASCGVGCVAIEAPGEKALRAGLSHFLHVTQGLHGIVVLDASEGYAAEDVTRVAEALMAEPNKFIIASRADNPGIGFMNKAVKAFAHWLLAAVHGRSVRDPWAGLRAIPSSLVHPFLELKGGGRRLMFGMVLSLHHKGVKAVSVPVGARYEPGDAHERRERMKDFLRILVLPFKYVSASLTATLLDYILFSIVYYMLNANLLLSQLAGRGTGAVTGYILNRNVVFRRKNNTFRKELLAAVQFAALAAFNYAVSVWIIDSLAQSIHIAVIAAKVIADIILYISTYLIQREIIFRSKAPAAE